MIVVVRLLDRTEILNPAMRELGDTCALSRERRGLVALSGVSVLLTLDHVLLVVSPQRSSVCAL